MANLTGTNGPDQINGTQANDVITGRSGDDELIGWNGDDLIHGRAGEDVLFGGQGADRLQGGSGNDVLAGYTGADRIWGDLGNDELHGGDGDDILLGREGDDILFGDDNTVWNEEPVDPNGTDVLIGGLGNDTFHAGEGKDTMIGNHGNDTFRFDFSIDPGLAGSDGRINWADTTISDFVRGPDTLVITQRSNDAGAGPVEVVDFHDYTFADLDTDGSGQIDGLDDATDRVGDNLVIDVGKLGGTIDHGAFEAYFGGTITLQGLTELRPVDFAS